MLPRAVVLLALDAVAALRSSSTVFLRLSWMSLSVATRIAVAVRLRLPSSSA